jgi:prepilin-type N-terminal cleavage/methylation domain-containing protein
MKKAFTLIEILIATAIASLLATSLFYAYYQTNKMVTFTSDYIDFFNTAILVDRQFTKDVSGAFIPVQAVKVKKAKQQEQKAEQKTDQKKQNESEEQPLLKDPFVSKGKDQLQLFSCITNNPMRIYWGKKSGGPQPAIARVVYTLQEDKQAPKNKPRFALYRQEGIELALAPYTKKESVIERYLIADNIKECTLTFFVIDEKEKEGREIIEFSEWRVGKDEKDLRSKVKVPNAVRLDLTLWNKAQTRERSFSFSLQLPAGFAPLPDVEPVAAKTVPGQKQAPVVGQPQTEERKQLLVSSANKVVDNIRGLFRT